MTWSTPYELETMNFTFYAQITKRKKISKRKILTIAGSVHTIRRAFH